MYARGLSVKLYPMLPPLPIADLSRLTPEHATIWFFLNFFGAYLIAKYARPSRPARKRVPARVPDED